MLSVQRPPEQGGTRASSTAGPRINPVLAIGLALAMLAAVFVAIGIYQARHPSTLPPSSSACLGGLSRAQDSALRDNSIQVDSFFPAGPPQVPISGDAALQISKKPLGPSAVSARCLVEALVNVSANGDVLGVPGFVESSGVDTVAWLVILQGLGQLAPTPIVPDVTATPKVGPITQRTKADGLDLAVFIDAYSGLSLGSVNLPSSTEG